MTRIETVLAGETMEGVIRRSERDMIVTTCNGERYSQAELRAAFSLVEDTDNWKNPIDAWINASLWPVVREAVIHFTGSVPTIVSLDLNGHTHPISPELAIGFTAGTFRGRLHIKASGYYSAIGA